MPTPIVRESGATIPLTGANAIVNNAYAAPADALRIEMSAIGTAYLLADFRLTNVAFGAAPVAGAIQLVKIPRDFAGTAGPTPSASMQATQVWTLGPMPQAANALAGWVMGVDSVPLDPDADYWLFNNGTAQTLAAGWTLTAQPWSPGT